MKGALQRWLWLVVILPAGTVFTAENLLLADQLTPSDIESIRQAIPQVQDAAGSQRDIYDMNKIT
jgi:hypothetical protein